MSMPDFKKILKNNEKDMSCTYDVSFFHKLQSLMNQIEYNVLSNSQGRGSTLKVHVKELKKEFSSNTCLLSKDIYNELKLKTNESYVIHLGQLSQKLCVEPQASEDESICFSNDAFNSLLLQDDLNMNIWKQDNDIYLGPVVGIFVCMDHFWCVKRKEHPSSAIQYVKASIAEGCLCYYFSLKDIDWSQNKIKGYSYMASSNEWGHQWFPVPDVIYDRHGNFPSREKKALLDQTRKQLANYKGMRFINSRNSFGGKWQECRRLSKYAEIKDFIPETIVYKDFNDVLRMLDKHKFIFLKSIFGSLGRSVMSIEQEHEQYRINVYDSGLKDMTFKNVSEVEKLVSNFKGGRVFIIQQGIRLLKYEGRNFDLRVLMQKDDSRSWKPIVFARVGRENSNITNQASGGESAFYDQLHPFLSSPSCKGAIPDSSKISDAAIKIAECIDKEFGPQGELGMDLGIDTCGKTWFIEVNEKPVKNWDPSYVDISKKNWIQTLFQVYELSGDYLKIDASNIDGVLPQARNIFKYAKLLAMNNPKTTWQRGSCHP